MRLNEPRISMDHGAPSSLSICGKPYFWVSMEQLPADARAAPSVGRASHRAAIGGRELVSGATHRWARAT
eukprot:scaffold3822_cov142-Isochrysis_galbana.AAC.7